MNKALFSRKAVDIYELRRRTGDEREKTHFVIEKVIELTSSEYLKFAENLLDDFDFIEDNIDLMYVDSERIMHCILVKEADGSSGILVESEGYAYARYSAYYEDDR